MALNEIEAGTFLRWRRGRNRFMPGGAPPMQPATRRPAGHSDVSERGWQAPGRGQALSPGTAWSVPE